MFNFNVDLAAECIKSLIVNTQCVTCGKLNGPCVRFPCGHSVCKDCAQRTRECLFCISSPSPYLIDKPQSARVNNTDALLAAFQDTFKIDVHKWLRLSDHLKVEKQVFPKCIQAPNKYSNRRKSFNSSFKNKENISPKFFAGEETQRSNIVKMKKSTQYVQNWLNQHENMPQNLPRRPFGDINVNTQTSVPKTRKAVLKPKNGQGNPKKSTFLARSHFKAISKSPSLINNEGKTNLEKKNLQKEIKKQKTLVEKEISSKCDTNESGIVLEDDPNVIEEEIDTSIIDKDKQAWLAVLEADKKEEELKKNKLHNNKRTDDGLLNVDKISLLENDKLEKIASKFPNHVVFLKKSPIFETCSLCKNRFKTKMNSNSKVNKTNDVAIVINSSTYTTTIKLSNCENKNHVVDRSSVKIQTDKEPLQKNEINNIDENITPLKRAIPSDDDGVPKKIQKLSIPQSLDLFGTEKEVKQYVSNNTGRRKCTVIEDSDTDSNISCHNTHEVIAEVHRSSVPDSIGCGILRTLSTREYENKTKQPTRCLTPNSSNSSDKENYDPNRKKRLKSGKKHKTKK